MKKLFEKLLGKKAAEPNLIGRAPRISFSKFENAFLRLPDGRKLPLRNLSETGLAVEMDSSSALEREVRGSLVLGDLEVAVQFGVVWQRDGQVGGSFEGDTTPIRGSIRRLFKEEAKAKEMSEVSSDRIAQEKEGEPRWYYAPGNYQLFLVEIQGKVKRFQLEWGENLVEGDGTFVRFGLIEAEEAQKPGQKKAESVRWHIQVGEEMRLKAIRIVENVPGLAASARAQIQQQVRG
jgi:hypothetical protein